SFGTWYDKAFFQTYDDQALLQGNPHPDFEAFLTEIGVSKGSNGQYYGGPTGFNNPSASLFTEERFIEFLAKDLQEASYLRYTNLVSNAVTVADDFDTETATRLITRENIFW